MPNRKCYLVSGSSDPKSPYFHKRLDCPHKFHSSILAAVKCAYKQTNHTYEYSDKMPLSHPYEEKHTEGWEWFEILDAHTDEILVSFGEGPVTKKAWERDCWLRVRDSRQKEGLAEMFEEQIEERKKNDEPKRWLKRKQNV